MALAQAGWVGALSRMPTGVARTAFAGARPALALLLFINLFNYVDRQVLAAVVPSIERSFFGVGAGRSVALLTLQEWCRAHLGFKPELALIGVLSMAFMVLYMIGAPVFGRLAERHSRWTLVGIGVMLWRLASGASGLAATVLGLLLTRCFVGVGEAAYGPVADAVLVLHGHPGRKCARLRARRRRSGIVHRRPRRASSRHSRRELALGLLPRGSPRTRPRAPGLLHERSAARTRGRACGLGSGAHPLARLHRAPADSVVGLLHPRNDGDDVRHWRHRFLDAVLPREQARRPSVGDRPLRWNHLRCGSPRHARGRRCRRQAPRSLSRFLLPRLGHRDARGFPVPFADPQLALPVDLGLAFRDLLLPLLQHGPDEHDSRQRYPSVDPGRRLRVEHLPHTCIG